MNCWRWLIASALVVSPALAEEASLFGEEILVPRKQVRMKVMLVRVPVEEASRLLVHDDRQADYWDLALPPLIEAGVAEVFEKSAIDGVPTEQLRQDWPVKHHVTAYSAIALAGETPELTKDLIQKGTVELGAGFRWKGSVVKLSAKVAETEWDMEWIDPKLEQREVGPWPAVGGHKAEHVARRSVGMVTRALMMPWSRAVLLGAQMELGAGESLHTGKAVLMFGRVEKGEDAENIHPLLLPRVLDTSSAESLWVLTVPAREYQVWNLMRTSMLEDEEAFRGWLGRAGSDGIKLESVCAGSGICVVGARKEWGTARRFRASANAASLLPVPSEALGLEQMDHLFSLSQGSIRSEWPTKAKSWNAVPVVFAEDGSQSHLDLPAVNMERFESWVEPYRDAPEMIRAWADGEGGMRVCFARRQPATAAERRKQKPRALQNAWCIETPVDVWSDRLRRITNEGQAAVAEEVLAAMRSGLAILVDGMTCSVSLGYVKSEGQRGAGFTALEQSVEVKPELDAFSLMPYSVAEDVAYTDWSSDWQANGSLFNHETRIKPQRTAWKLTLPERPEIKWETTILERSAVQIAPELADDEACVLAAFMTPASNEGKKTIRWWIARQTPLDPAKRNELKPSRYLDAQVTDASGAVRDRAIVLLHSELETVVSRGVEVPFVEARDKAPEPVRVKESEQTMTFQHTWQMKRHVVGLVLAVEADKWTLTSDYSPHRVVEDIFRVSDPQGEAYELSLQRPLFAQQTYAGQLPPQGETSKQSMPDGLCLEMSVR